MILLNEQKTCPVCSGTGQLDQKGTWLGSYRICPRCNSSGTIPKGEL